MRTTGKRSVVLYILLLACAAGMIWLLFSFLMNGKTWASQPYNLHFSAAELGEITDRDGAVLAATEEDVRKYNENEEVRRALLHTVGDNGGYITSSVQNTMRAKLSGYNPLTGAGHTVFNQLGKNLELTVDADVCVAAYNAMGGRRGAVLVYDYENGDILCKVSAPNFDPGAMPEDLLTNDGYRGVLVDNTLASSYTPGSIFKLVTQAAAMDQFANWDTREYSCEGAVEIGGSTITCLGVHGTQTAGTAFGNSCNVYYALLAVDIGAANLQTKAEAFGFNRSLNFDGVECRSSSIDLSSADANQLGWSGVGQYTLLANPYHMMTLMGAIANEGSYTAPRLTRSLSISDSIGSGDRKYMEPEQAKAIGDMMRYNVSTFYGDGMFPEGMEVCAKTGTAEVGEGIAPNCWMVGFSRHSAYPYAFVVVVEEGEGGISTAGSIASQVMNALL